MSTKSEAFNHSESNEEQKGGFNLFSSGHQGRAKVSEGGELDEQGSNTENGGEKNKPLKRLQALADRRKKRDEGGAGGRFRANPGFTKKD